MGTRSGFFALSPSSSAASHHYYHDTQVAKWQQRLAAMADSERCAADALALLQAEHASLQER